MTTAIAHQRAFFNTSLPLRGGLALQLAPIACPHCATIQRPIDVEPCPLRLICRSCHAVLIEVMP